MAEKLSGVGRAVTERALKVTVVDFDRRDVGPRLKIGRALEFPNAIARIGDSDVHSIRSGTGRDACRCARGDLGKCDRHREDKRRGESGELCGGIVEDGFHGVVDYVAIKAAVTKRTPQGHINPGLFPRARKRLAISLPTSDFRR